MLLANGEITEFMLPLAIIKSWYRRAEFISTEFKKLGFSSSTQNYTFTVPQGVRRWFLTIHSDIHPVMSQTISGTNAYAIMSSPRASGAEAIVICASWLSRIDDGAGTINIRGVSTVLALANFLRSVFSPIFYFAKVQDGGLDYSLWAKDIIFVVSDGYLDGMHAWLSSYHGTTHSSKHNGISNAVINPWLLVLDLDTDYLTLSSGVIWTALNIDYPGHSFSHLGVFFGEYLMQCVSYELTRYHFERGPQWPSTKPGFD